MAALTIRDDAFEIPDEDTSDDDFVAVLRERNQLRQRMSDWLMHALGCRRRAHQYKHWALEAEAEGNLPTYRHFRQQSDRSWRLAWAALREARLNKEIINGC
jgi:hypothetical protein